MEKPCLETAPPSKNGLHEHNRDSLVKGCISEQHRDFGPTSGGSGVTVCALIWSSLNSPNLELVFAYYYSCLILFMILMLLDIIEQLLCLCVHAHTCMCNSACMVTASICMHIHVEARG